MMIATLTAVLLAQAVPEGIFAYRKEVYRSPVGAIEVVCRRRECKTHADGEPLEVEREGRGISFSLASGERFEGEIGRLAIEGFWIQPEDGFGGQAMATPLDLMRSARGTFRGEPQPRERDVRLLIGFGKRDGESVAAIRNPEWNFTGGVIQYKAEEGVLSANRGGREINLSYRYDEAADTLHLTFPRLGEIAMVRADSAQVADFLPRMGGFNGLTPIADGHGWQAGEPEAAGFNVERLEELVRILAEHDPLSARPDLVHSVLVARDGRLVLEEYFFGHGREDGHDLRSAGKTFASILLGAAMADGAELDESTPVMPLLRRTIPAIPEGDGREAMTLADLMTHRSGLACDDNDDQSPGTEWRLWESGEDNLWAQTARLPMVRRPGEIYAYCSGGMNLVGGALAAALEERALSLIDRLIAEPLGWSRYHWNLMPSGDAYLGGGAELIPRDFLKLGQMALDGGVWNGERLVSEEWIERSTTPWVEISAATTGLSEEAFGNMYFGGKDGLAWHMFDIDVDGRTYRSFEAAGNGGQVVVVVPELDLVIAFNGGNYGQGYIWGRWRDRFVGGHIIPALTAKN
ncbi:serine hydrolase domain-containing protein [Parvularcula lutaonensis]|uniref:Serine hydrolase domain-containing protein n=1 Tax=Parvularcula lutaonensis TaxID=491923 RepID=A0ABV7M710_9PROT|nr:serine hydrolase [Parvularcula lutaonensis]GGY56309.1 hypothetical protein GCM10007148_27320 [Parvularcula lutaonensis]